LPPEAHLGNAQRDLAPREGVTRRFGLLTPLTSPAD
jgi:hypothetical protein